MAKKGVVAQLLLFIFGREEMAKKRSVPPKVKSKQKCEAFSVRGWVVILLGWWAVGGGALPGCSLRGSGFMLGPLKARRGEGNNTCTRTIAFI